MNNSIPFKGLTAQQVFTYPDGTKGYNRPVDGEIFYVTDSNQRPVSIWQWDDFLEQWFNVTNGKPAKMTKSQKIDPVFGMEIATYDDIGIDWSNFNTKCECGSEKVGSPGHSSWCPKYTR